MKKYDLIIIGGGPIGLFSAFYAGRRKMTTLIVEASEFLGGQPQSIYSEKDILDIPGFISITGQDLSKQLIQQAESDMVTVAQRTKAVSYEGNLGDGFVLNCLRGEHSIQFAAKALLLTTGVGEIEPRLIGVPGEKEFTDKGVGYFLKSKEHARDKKVVILGGGDSAVDWANMLQGIASEVHLVHRRDEFRAQEESVSRLLSSATNLHLSADVKNIAGGEAVSAVNIICSDGVSKSIACDMVIVAFGFRIQLEVLSNWGVDLEKGGVVVNQSMETSVPGIFAAGDVAFVPGVGATKLIAIGFAQGTIAVNSAKTRIDPKASFFPGHSTAWK